VVLVESERYHIDHIAKLNDVVAELKQVGKTQRGSVVVQDRRGGAEIPRTGSDG
jgi:hypothetical protein